MSGRSRARPAAGSERGQVSIELIGFLPVLLTIALAAVQLGIGAYTAEQAGTAARAAARTASLDDPLAAPQEAGRAAISGWLADRTRISVTDGGQETTATAAVQIPSVIPGIGFGEATRSATMRLPGD